MEQETRLIWLAAILTGTAIGLSVGHAGLDSDVLAAVLPVIITGIVGGAAAVVLRLMSHWPEEARKPSFEIREVVRVATMAVVAFSIAYVAGMYSGRLLENRWSLGNERQTVERLVERLHVN